MDLLERRLKKHSEKLKSRAEEAFKFKQPSKELFASNVRDIEREVQKYKLKVRGFVLISGFDASPDTARRVLLRCRVGWLLFQLHYNQRR